MLRHPYGKGEDARAKSIPDPEMTLGTLREQTEKSILFLKDLRSMQKNVKLKFCSDTPFLKRLILGDYLWSQHYRRGFEEDSMPVCPWTQPKLWQTLPSPLRVFHFKVGKDRNPRI